jgi:hypothetical protein
MIGLLFRAEARGSMVRVPENSEKLKIIPDLLVRKHQPIWQIGIAQLTLASRTSGHN